VHRPQVLFLDEPTSGVDPVGRRRFWNILFWLAHEEGVTILITTHHMSEAELCDHLVLMYDGRVVADASPARMKRDVEAESGHLLEVRAEPPGRLLEVLAEAGFADCAPHGRSVHVLAANPEADRLRIEAALARHGLTRGSVTRQELSMEDVFVCRVTALQRAAEASVGLS